MLRLRTLLALATCALALLPAVARADAALNLDGFAVTFPKAAALCSKADKGRLGKKLTPSKGKVKAACQTLKRSYSDALKTLLATTTPLRQQVKDIVTAQRAACLQARKSRDRLGCRKAALDARAQLAPIRAQIAAAQATARASYEKARKAFWASVKKLRGAAGISPDGPAGEPPVSDVPPDTALDTAP